MISIIVPCYNQGRFLTDCLESVALQTRPPAEVIVVNDGSTDAETNALCARLPHYSYPFPLRVIVQENRGLPAARNTGIRQSKGDIILPLDGDDKLLPEAVEEYERFFAAHPDIDICYPDVLFHGTMRWNFVAPLYNPWRHLQHNWFVPCTAIRRRVFAEGHEYWEEMRHGYEDWEFWLRTCVLGPYRAAALCRRVFAYRKWGFSMLAATQHDEQVLRMRRRHATLGLWSRAIEARLRTRHAPSHLWLRSTPLLAEAEDIVCQPLDELETAVRGNAVSRFLWFGEAGARAPAALRFLVSRVAEAHCAPLYVFQEERASTPYLIVLDRVAVLQAQHVDIFSPTPRARAVLVQTRGDRYPWPVAVRVDEAWSVPADSPLTPLQRHPARPILPVDIGADPRREADVYYFIRRDLDPASLPHPEGRVLVLALPDLTAGPIARHVRTLLAQPAVRNRFDAVYLLTFDAARHDAHTELEPLAESIYHLGAFALEAERKLKLLEQFLTETGASDLLLVNAAPALEIIPRLRTARQPVRIIASFPYSVRALPGDTLHRLASEYANLVDRVVTESDEQTRRLVDHLYFPATKVKTLPPSAEEIVAWLFPSDERPRDHLAELFGIKAASRAA